MDQIWTKFEIDKTFKYWYEYLVNILEATLDCEQKSNRFTMFKSI